MPCAVDIWCVCVFDIIAIVQAEKKRNEKRTQWNVFDIEFIDSHHTKYIIAFLSIWMDVVFHMRSR